MEYESDARHSWDCPATCFCAAGQPMTPRVRREGMSEGEKRIEQIRHGLDQGPVSACTPSDARFIFERMEQYAEERDALQSEVAELKIQKHAEEVAKISNATAMLHFKDEVARLKEERDKWRDHYNAICEPDRKAYEALEAERDSLREALEIATSESCECAIVGGLNGKPYREVQCNRCMRIDRLKQSLVPSVLEEKPDGG